MFKGIKLLGIVTITLLTTGCCMTDYSKKIRKVADPMLVELDTFYQTHKRHPNSQERDALLLKAGCEKVVGNVCFKNKKELSIYEAYTNSDKGYSMDIRYKGTYCFYGLYRDGTVRSVACKKIPCIKWDH